MKSSSEEPIRPLFLGIEGGGTHTVAILADARRNFLQRFEAGPANLKLLTDAQVLGLFKSIASAFPAPDALAIGMAGARSKPDWERMRIIAGKVWRDIPCHATNDLETALAAAEGRDDVPEPARVLILSGTGSCCYGRNPNGKTAKIGGWGHILGDKGSGYEIGLRALKAVVYYFDRDGAWSKLGRQLLHRLQLNEPNELIAWAQAADKSQIAGLAMEVFNAWQKGDKIAADVLASAEDSLAEDAATCARQLAGPRSTVRFILAGSVLIKQPNFAKLVGARLKKIWPGAVVSPLERESAWGAVELAQKIWSGQAPVEKFLEPARKTPKVPKSPPLEKSLGNFGKVSPTEQRHPRS
ncbi:MAG: N-acetylmuramic acid 6-phosphate etherase, partial [Pedosphaera sp.]|nr:N-acetylmuramic acid 6-phosphate etherase [Pedosphaera sp.]